MSNRNRRLGFATVAILRAIHEGRGYGLEIIATTALSPGTVYVTLGRLEKRAFVASSWERQSIAVAEGRPRRRYYRLTRSGTTALDAALTSYGELMLGSSVSPGGDRR